MRTCPVVKWLRLPTPSAGSPGSIPGIGTRSHMPKGRMPHTTKKIKDPVYFN